MDLIRLFLRLCFLGFCLGRFKKRISKPDLQRGFVDVVFPKPAKDWKVGDDFLWETKKPISKEIEKGDWVVFFGYKKPSGWKAKMVLKLF